MLVFELFVYFLCFKLLVFLFVGMGFKPMPDVEYTLIRFQQSEKTYKDHIKSISNVLKRRYIPRFCWCSCFC